MNYEQIKQLKVYQTKIQEINAKKVKPTLSFEVEKVFPLITKNKKIIRKINENRIIEQNRFLGKRLEDIRTNNHSSISNLPKISKMKS